MELKKKKKSRTKLRQLGSRTEGENRRRKEGQKNGNEGGVGRRKERRDGWKGEAVGMEKNQGI